MKDAVVFALVICLTICECRQWNSGKETLQDPDMLRNVSELISSKGYPVEDHYVQTADGFILSMQRIPHGRLKNSKKSKKGSVLLMHGLLDNSAEWVINFPHQSLGFILADAGYDVWLGNSRGNRYSNRHVKYTSDQKEYWDFSFEEMAQFDLPAMIDYILNVTGEGKLYYIGYSQGSTQAFAFLSENPEYSKIKLAITLAPVMKLGQMTSSIRYLVPFKNGLYFMLNMAGVKQFPPETVRSSLIEWMCQNPKTCEEIIFQVCGKDKSQFNESRFDVYAKQLMTGSSLKSVMHLAQFADSNSYFKKFDYGKSGNMKKYNQATPPKYDVSCITTPVAIVWSLNDKLVNRRDLQILKKKLHKSLVSSYCVPYPEFSHADYIVAINASRFVYDHVLSLLARS